MGWMGSGRKNYSASSEDYKLLEEIGSGASATVHRAIYIPFSEIVSIKCLDLDRCNSNLDEIRREAQTMSLIDHPNVIRAYCSFVVDRCLWVVMPFMAEGSCLHLMKIAYSNGFEESIISTILKETLKALEYLHRHGHIHRDVKAGNILLDSNGVVKLGDFGVSACMFDNGDRQRSRNTFKGTPCWMAPEVMQSGGGYDFKADIWSFGITALELAHGHAPFSKYPPMKVLLMTLQNAPPGLDYERDKKFSKSFKEMVAMCLVKDQTKRPTAEKLLKHSFFKNAKPLEISVKSLLAELPPLWDRVKQLQHMDAAQLALKRMPSAEQEAISQSEYKRGVSAWNFDVEDLKAQASLDDDDLNEVKEEDENLKLLVYDKDPSVSRTGFRKSVSTNDTGCRVSMGHVEGLDASCLTVKEEISEIDLTNSSILEKNGTCEKDDSSDGPLSSTSGKEMEHEHCKIEVGKTRRTHSGPLVPSTVFNHSSSEREHITERCEGENQSATEKYKRDARKGPNFSGPLMLPNRASANSLSAPIRSSGGFRDSLEDKSKTNNVVQIRGRFSVTSENVDLPISQSPKEISNSAIPTSLLMPYLQNLFQQTAFQQDLIMNLLNNLQQNEIVDAFQTGKLPPQARNSENDTIIETGSSERERLLLIKISELQARMINLTDELTAAKRKHIQLQQQLNAAYGQEEVRSRRERDS
ncbi:serine/threonine-protein kinase BLUS1-like isoform X2 [Tasmannia lanceolata]|uniref:serine/threonine-protein kinase BLUS1-like isoform X2 n=1 Tax=Tasmannia lanceolata TaxID=3420 RepID=UPI0040639EE9